MGVAVFVPHNFVQGCRASSLLDNAVLLFCIDICMSELCGQLQFVSSGPRGACRTHFRRNRKLHDLIGVLALLQYLPASLWVTRTSSDQLLLDISLAEICSRPDVLDISSFPCLLLLEAPCSKTLHGGTARAVAEVHAVSGK